MKLNNYYFFSFLVIGAFFSLISNIITFRSYVIQQDSVSDMNNIIPKMTLSEALKNNLTYPNINIYTVPFKTQLGRVYLRDSMYKEAINIFHKARKDNPYLMINENYLAETYLRINKKDSFDYYANRIFSKAPNHANHFTAYIKSLGPLKNSIKLDSAFNLINFKSPTIWKIYLGALFNVQDSLKVLNKNLVIADSIYPRNDDIQFTISSIKYGFENVKKSEEFISIADQLAIDGNFEGSIDVLKIATELNPMNFNIYDKLATSYFKLEKYDSSLNYINKINLRKFEDLGRFYLIKGINLVKLNQKEEGCKSIYESIMIGNKEAIKAYRSFCN